MPNYSISQEEELIETAKGYLISLCLVSKQFFTKQSAEFPENYKFS
jgi:hypothetical protein